MKKTLLFCLILLAWNLNSFAEKGYVYERITSMDELVSGKYVIALEGGSDLKECYAITDKGTDVAAGLTDLAAEHLVDPFLVNVPSTMIADVTRSGSTFTIKYGNEGFSTDSPVKLRSVNNPSITITALNTSHFNIKYNNNYLCARTSADLTIVSTSISYQRWQNQFSKSPYTIAGASYSNSYCPYVFSFFIQHEAETIILNNAGVKTEYVGVVSLPATIRTVDGHTERIFRWRDPEGNLYNPGTIYPTEGYYNGDAPITLTAIYREFEEHWLPISNHVDIDNGDTIVLTVEDGGDGGKCYALTKPASTGSCTMTEKNNPFDATCKWLVFDSDPTNDNASFKLDALNGKYLFIAGNIQLHATNPSPVTLIPWGDGHYKFRLSTSYLSVDKSKVFYNKETWQTSYTNQHETRTNITSLGSTYAAAWTIYRKVMCYYGTATFDVRDDQGFPVAAQSGKTITFPSADAKFGWKFVGWSKKPEGPIYRKTGETAYLSGDQTFYAVYEPTVFLTLNLNNHGHWETEDRQNDSIMGGPSHNLPAPNGNFSYGFMGWAKTPTATTPQYLAGETYAITEDETLYAVYKDTHIFRPIHSLDDIQDGDKVVIVLESGAGDNARIALEHSPLTTGSSMTVDTMSLTSYLIDKEALLHPNENVVFDFYKDDNNKWLFGVDRIGQTSKFYVRYKEPSSTTAAKKIDLINASNSATDRQWTPIWRETSHRIYLKNGNAYYMTWTVATPSYFSGTISSVINQPSNSNQKIYDQIAWWKDLTANHKIGSSSTFQAAITLYKAVPNDTLFYDAHGGTIEDNITQSIGGTLFLPVASKNGFVFKGWSDGEHLYKAGTCYPVSGNMNGNTTLTAEFVVTRNSFERISSLTQLQDGDTIIMTFGDGVGMGTIDYHEYGIVMENCTTKVNQANIADTNKINLDATYKWVITNAYNGTYRLYNAASKAFLSLNASGSGGAKVTFEKACIYYTLDKFSPGAYLDEQNDSIQISLTHWANNSTPVKLANRANSLFFVYCPKVTAASLRCGLTSSSYAKNQWAEGGGKTLYDMDGGNSIQYNKPAAITIYRMKQDPLCHYVFNAGEHGTCATSYINDDKTITLPNVTPYSGFEFTGWSDGANIYHAGDSYPYTGKSEVIFTAQYTILPLVINENNFDATILDDYHQTQINVSLTRQLAINSLNTFAVPFDMNASEIETTFGEGTELYAMSTVQVENGILTIFFEDASAIAAGTPYLMRPTKNDIPAVIEISSRTIDNTLRSVSNNGITFHPVFSPTVLNADGKTLFLGTGDLLYRPITTGSMKGLRAYFTQDEVTSAPIRYMIGRPHGITTDWNQVNGEDQLTKFIHNGQLIIRKNGKLYNALGAEIRK